MHKVGYQRFRETFGVKVRSFLHRCIQEEMEFLDISSLGAGFNFWGHFEGLNEGFLRSRFLMIARRHD
jgi:hypothetical protein